MKWSQLLQWKEIEWNGVISSQVLTGRLGGELKEEEKEAGKKQVKERNWTRPKETGWL